MTRGILALLLTFAAVAAVAEPVTLKAADGVMVHGEVWRAASTRAPMIVAFHQAGSSHDEYTPIAKRLNAAGYSMFAIDQRSGGDMYGVNRTNAAIVGDPGYEAALPDMEAALAWANADAKGAPIVVWGSSYSSSLVFVLAARHSRDVAGLLAFSPGEYFDGKPDLIRTAAAAVTVPVFIDQSNGADEIAASKAILNAVKGRDKQQFIAKGKSVHGSSTLRADHNAAGAEEHWQAVMKFLRRVAPAGLAKAN